MTVAGNGARDFDLPVIERGNIDALEQHLDNWPQLAIKLPEKEIAAWRSQFTRTSQGGTE